MMSEDTKKLMLELGVQDKDFNKQIKAINKELRVTQAEFKATCTNVDNLNKPMKGLKTQSADLSKQFDMQKSKLELLNRKLVESEQKNGKNSATTKNLREQVAKTTTSMNQLKQKLSETNAKIKQQTLEIERENSKLLQLSIRLESIGSKMTKFGSSINKISMPISLAGVAGAKFFMDFEQGMAKIDSIADTTKITIDQVKEGIENLSNAVGVNVDELAEATYQIISSNIDTAKSIDFLEDSTKLAKAGFTDTTTAVDVLTTTINAYKLEAEDATGISDELITMQNKGKVTIGELGDSLGDVISIASQLDIKTKSLFASIASLTRNGLKADKAMTGLKSILTSVLSPSAEASKLAKELGINFSSVHLKNVGLPKFLEEIKMATGGNNEQLATLFGNVRALNSIMSLTGKASQDFTEILLDMEKSAGATDIAFEKVTNTTKEELSRAIQSLKNSFSDLMESSKPMILEGARLIKKFSKMLKDMSPEQQAFIVKMGLGTVALGLFTTTVGKFLTTGASMIKFFGNLNIKIAQSEMIMKVFNATLLATPVGWIVGAIGAVAGIALVMHNSNKKHEESVRKLTDAYEEFDKVIKDGSVSDLEEYIQKTDKLTNKLVNSLKESIKDMNDLKASGNFDELIADEIQADIDYFTKEIEQAGFTVNKLTGEIVELNKVQEKINIEKNVNEIKKNVEARINENQEIVQLIDKYSALNSVNNKSKAQMAEMSNLSQALNENLGGLTLSYDENGNAIIDNVNVLSKRKEALELEMQTVQKSAYEQAKAEINRQKVMVYGTELTIGEIEKRISAYNIESEYVNGKQMQMFYQYSLAQDKLRKIRKDLTELSPSTSFSFNGSVPTVTIDKQEELNKQIQETISKYTKLRDVQNKNSLAWEFWNDKIKEQQKLLDKSKDGIEDLQKELSGKYLKKITEFSNKVVENLKKRTEEERDLEKSDMEDKIKTKKKLYDRAVELAKEHFEEKKKLIEDESDLFEQGINDQLKALDKLEDSYDEQQTVNDEDERISEINKMLGMDIGVKKREELEKELSDIYKDRERREYKKSLDIKREQLTEELAEHKKAKDEELKQLQNSIDEQLTYGKKIYESQVANLEENLIDLQNFYNKKLEKANLNAEAEKIIMDNNQQEIITLLSNYGSQYELVGQSLGERLLQGFKDKFKLEDLINSTLNSAMANANNGSSNVSNVTNNTNYYSTPTTLNNSINVKVDSTEISALVEENINNKIGLSERGLG